MFNLFFFLISFCGLDRYGQNIGLWEGEQFDCRRTGCFLYGGFLIAVFVRTSLVHMKVFRYHIFEMFLPFNCPGGGGAKQRQYLCEILSQDSADIAKVSTGQRAEKGLGGRKRTPYI